MAQVVAGRFAGRMDGDFVVFVIGMRVNQLLAVHKWWPVSQAMPRMLAELGRHPEMGFLHSEYWVGWRQVMTVQYWRSFEQLHAYAHAKDLEHLPAWAEFNRRVVGSGAGNPAVGVFHETYVVRGGQYEAVYVNMPRMGLAKAGEMVPAEGRFKDARARMGLTAMEKGEGKREE